MLRATVFEQICVELDVGDFLAPVSDTSWECFPLCRIGAYLYLELAREPSAGFLKKPWSDHYVGGYLVDGNQILMFFRFFMIT